jgi:hypothetical protein
MLLFSGAEAPRSDLARKLPRAVWISAPIEDKPRHASVVGLRSGPRIDRHRARAGPDPHLSPPFGHHLFTRQNGGKPLVVLFRRRRETFRGLLETGIIGARFEGWQSYQCENAHEDWQEVG